MAPGAAVENGKGAKGAKGKRWSHVRGKWADDDRMGWQRGYAGTDYLVGVVINGLYDDGVAVMYVYEEEMTSRYGAQYTHV